MNSFNIEIGTRIIKIQPEPAKDNPKKQNRFKIYADNDDSWLDEKDLDIEQIPVDGLLGILSIKSLKDFTFEGQGPLSGEDLLFLVSHIIQYLNGHKKNPD